jgi:hypothetical protein
VQTLLLLGDDLIVDQQRERAAPIHARASYHHEMAHHWGWPATHDWAACDAANASSSPFFVPPVLLGWF